MWTKTHGGHVESLARQFDGRWIAMVRRPFGLDVEPALTVCRSSNPSARLQNRLEIKLRRNLLRSFYYSESVVVFNPLKCDFHGSQGLVVFCDVSGRAVDKVILRAAAGIKLKHLTNFLEDTSALTLAEVADKEVRGVTSDDAIKCIGKRLTAVKAKGFKSEWAAVCWTYLPELVQVDDARKLKLAFDLSVRKTAPLTGKLTTYTHEGKAHELYTTDWSDLRFLGAATHVGAAATNELLLDL